MELECMIILLFIGYKKSVFTLMNIAGKKASSVLDLTNERMKEKEEKEEESFSRWVHYLKWNIGIV